MINAVVSVNPVIPTHSGDRLLQFLSSDQFNRHFLLEEMRRNFTLAFFRTTDIHQIGSIYWTGVAEFTLTAAKVQIRPIELTEYTQTDRGNSKPPTSPSYQLMHLLASSLPNLIQQKDLSKAYWMDSIDPLQEPSRTQSQSFPPVGHVGGIR